MVAATDAEDSNSEPISRPIDAAMHKRAVRNKKKLIDAGKSAILSGLKQHSKTSKGMLEAKFGGKIPLKNLGPQKKYSRMEDYFDGSSDDDYYDRVYDDDEKVEGEDSNGLQEAKDKTDFSMSCD
ncbi:hypothetical protein ACH5RR_022848 [Cinchona calisaya]|uniref:Uncharacterized protein n=1 Tax=Cinchona calisaya TaxID=153742 RepID=A0ABD2Z8Y6_9GENT